MKIYLRKTVVLSFLLLYSSSLLCQDLSKKELVKIVQDADIAFYYDEDYEKAAELYKSILDKNPDNTNFSAKLGICYLNIDGKKSEALKLLQFAAENVVSNDRDYVEYGEQAPLDTYLYLAIAYQKVDSLQKALAIFNEAKKELVSTGLFKEDYIDLQIRNCRYAIEMKKKPLTIISNLFAPWLNEYPGASNPALSKNDSVFVFTVKNDKTTKIFCSYKSNGIWRRPRDITKQLGGYDRFYSNSITGDGKFLVLYMDDGGDGNLYYSTRKDSSWTKIKSIGKPVNTIYWQSHGFITPDGQTLYFSSNKPGGEGELDIWVSDRGADGKWGEPVNCGNVINTPYNEDTPFYDPDNDALLFSSVGHISMGGYDVFRSVKRNGRWTNPMAMPYNFNNTSENTFFILNNNAPGFVTSIFDESTDSRNIYSVVALDPADKITMAKGNITLEDGMNVEPGEVEISLYDLKNPDDRQNIEMKDSSSFSFDIKPGDYQVLISHTGYVADTLNLSLPLYFLSNYISVDASLTPEKVASRDFLEIENILFDFDSSNINEDAIILLENLISVLSDYPDLKIEVAGYTDSKGGIQYNMNLADRRAQEVIDYFSDRGIQPSRFVKKAFGKSNFVAVNTNIDGSDNPEGRKYNRRVAFGIIDPQTGVTITHVAYTPERIRQPYSMKYSIVLKKTRENAVPENFNILQMTEMHFIREIKVDSYSLYVLGAFYNKYDAIKYRDYAISQGFNEAYVVNQYEINTLAKSLTLADPDTRMLNSKIKYTVQIKAARQAIEMNTFKGVEGVKELRGKDGYYRYFVGEFNSIKEARASLIPLRKSGYDDAFIRDINLLMQL